MGDDKNVNWSFRKTHPFIETMTRFHSAIENNLYAAEIKCGEESEAVEEECNACPFMSHTHKACTRDALRKLIGEPLKHEPEKKTD